MVFQKRVLGIESAEEKMDFSGLKSVSCFNIHGSIGLTFSTTMGLCSWPNIPLFWNKK